MEIGLLLSKSISEFRLKALNPILQDPGFKVKVAVIDTRPGKPLKQKLIKNIRRGRGGYIVIMAFEKVFSKKSTTTSVSSYEFCALNGIEIIETNEPYSATTIENIKKHNLDVLVLTGGFGIIKQPLLDATPIGVLSYHHGNMRKYRGMPPALWELYNNEKEMGVTVQIISAGIDNGIPIAEKTIEINKNDTVSSLQNRAYAQSEDMLYTAVKKLSDKDFKFNRIEHFGKIYTLPNLRQWILLNIKLVARRLK